MVNRQRSSSKPFLSVIVPVHNIEGNLHFLKSWLNLEILDQLRVILVHDKESVELSPQTDALVEGLTHPNFNYVTGDFKSPGMARNFGLERIDCDAEWIAFWDSDDLPNVFNFQEMILLSESHGKKFAVGGYEVQELNSIENPKVNIPTSKKLEDLGRNVGLWRWAFNVKELDLVRFQDLNMGEDQDFLFDLNPQPDEIFYSTKVVYRYHKGRNGQLTKDIRRIREIASSFKYLCKQIELNPNVITPFQIRIFTGQLLTTLKYCKWNIKVRAGIQSIRIYLTYLIRSDAKKFRSNSVYDTANADKNSCEFLLFGGYGNQLFQIAQGLSECQVGKVTMIRHIPRSGKVIDRSLDQYHLPPRIRIIEKAAPFWITQRALNLGLRLSSKFVPSKNSRFKLWAIKVVAFAVGILMKQGITYNLGVGQDDSRKSSPGSLNIGYFQSQPHHAVLDSLKEMELISITSEALHMFERAEKNRILAVHVRLGDYAENQSIGLIDARYYKAGLLHLWKSGNYDEVFVFSNEIRKAKEMLNLDESIEVSYVGENTLSSSETFELLRRANGYVISNSTFSWWAANLSHTKNPAVVCPDPWFKEMPEPKELIPKNWIRMTREFVDASGL